MAESAVTSKRDPAGGLANIPCQINQSRLTWPTNDIVGICEIDNNDLVRIIDLFTTALMQTADQQQPLRGKTQYVHAHIVVRLEGTCRVRDGLGLDTECRQLQVLRELQARVIPR